MSSIIVIRTDEQIVKINKKSFTKDAEYVKIYSDINRIYLRMILIFYTVRVNKMKTLLKNGSYINVFTGEIRRENVLIGNDTIIGIGDYSDKDADTVTDISGCIVAPGFIDGHIHIESTMLTPPELAKAVLPHGTTAIIADPHEIANVCGTKGIDFMLKMSEGLPLSVFINIPSCVPATPLDESGAEISADDMTAYFSHPRITGLAEMMNYPGVLADDPGVLAKISAAKAAGKIIDGHAPLLAGRDLDRYISAGISTDHECSTLAEAEERIRKGQWLMVREGTVSRNLEALLPMFEEPFCRRSLLVTDDLHPADIINEGEIDRIIRKAVKAGKDPVTCIQMATLNAAQCFGLKYMGAVAPGYRADLLILSDIESIRIRDVYCAGKTAVKDGICLPFDTSSADPGEWGTIFNSFRLDPLTPDDFYIEPKEGCCRVIGVIPGQVITEEYVMKLDLSVNNGIDTDKDVIKLAVIERHKNTGHRGIGYIRGIGLKHGAIAASVSHDSHNIIVIGTNDEDMAYAANRIREMNGGCTAVENGKVLAELPLPVAGLMSDKDAHSTAEMNCRLNDTVRKLGVPDNISPFMNMAFVSLSVIPHIKMTTHGLVDAAAQRPLSLMTDNS